MLEQLLEKQLIQLPECKRPEQAEKVDDPNYCKCHRVINHPIEKCFVLKELIVRLAHEKKIELDLKEKVAPEDSQEKERLIEEDDEGWTVVTRRKKRKSTQIQKESRFYRNYTRGNNTQNNKKKKKTRKLKLVHEEDKDFPRTQCLVTLADFFPTRFLCDHQDENPGVVACRAINATKEESIPLRLLEEEVSKDLSRFNVDGLLSLPQETKTILINASLNLAASSSSAPTATYENSRTTYKLLLSRPWIHGNGVVTSTLHQCFKFYQDVVKKVEADSNPFSEAESHFADAKFYLKNDSSPEAVYVEVPLVKREDNLQLKSLASEEPHKSTRTFHSEKSEASTSTTKSVILMGKKTSNPPILRYVCLSRCKKGKSPFVKSPHGLKVGDIEVLKESFTTPLTKVTMQKIKINLTEAKLPQRRTKDGFDPKAYKFMAKAGYDFTTHTEFKSLKTQKKLLREGHAIPMSRKGLRYKSPESIRITRKGMEKVVDSNHITVKEVDSMEEKEGDSQRTSTFDRISPHVARAPVFDRGIKKRS
ncbi:ty3-gypsy retrotransposon protein [Cucumis melo var. makuwa]|uniref:Ty3-gypsy retrotransposon protein n=1 Tax=Cucumis melo var. makuwa TaxID=1194695 RepID=A0A5D3BG93_CUCMM|nr:ty3-gypsy retrotransposon protein [Cucumis melo var. makuwa]TYJ98782.1 ty3-gypsy retrotransposon protein [Cucumis melo var. makuwa]